MSASALPETEKPASFWEDFVDILFAPTRVFERRRGAGAGRVILVLAILGAIIGAATAPLSAPLRDRQADVAVAGMRAKGMTEEQVAQGRAITEKFATVGAVGGLAIGLPIGVVISALFVWLVGRLFGAEKLGFGGAALISAYSVYPSLLSILGGSALLAVLDADNLPLLQAPGLNLAMFLGRDASPMLVALAQRIGVAEIWSVVITAGGLAVIGRMPKQKAWIASVILFVLGSLVAIAFALRQAAAMAG